MPGPFSGMDPYLETQTLWPSFHKQLIASLYQVVLPGLADKYRLRVGLREYVSEVPLFTSILRESHSEEYLEIRSRPDAKIVTLIDLVSLGNKTTTAGRREYLVTREEAKQQRAAIVEIDLLTQGKPLLDYMRENLPEHDYTVTVTRGATPERFEIYTSQLMKRLPKFRLPLAAEDKDIVLDLHMAVVRAIEQGNFESSIRYDEPLPADVMYSTATRAWIQDQLTLSGYPKSNSDV